MVENPRVTLIVDDMERASERMRRHNSLSTLPPRSKFKEAKRKRTELLEKRSSQHWPVARASERASEPATSGHVPGEGRTRRRQRQIYGAGGR